MKEKPIIFSGEMVRAILDGRKTQTRRVIKKQPVRNIKHRESIAVVDGIKIYCPYGTPGARLWVKESWFVKKEYDSLPPSKLSKEARRALGYLASRTKPEWAGRTRSARFMPRWASRIMLEIVSVRVERLQDISDNDALAEGILITPEGIPITTPRKWYGIYWNRLNAKRGWPWESNSWVWVIGFRMLKPRRL